MKASDLRIGNKLLRDGIVVIIDARSIFDIWENDPVEYGYKPIPLTEQWLIKLGFEEDQDYTMETVYEYHSPGHTFQLAKENEGAWYCGNEETHLEIKHVHQLQNLYHALTGQEL